MQCQRTVQVAGEVDSMLMESGMLFVGVHQKAPRGKESAEYLKSLPGSILVYNLQAGSEHALPGHMVSLATSLLYCNDTSQMKSERPGEGRKCA